MERIKEKRSLFNIVFGKKKQDNMNFADTLKLLSGFNAKFSNISENIEDNLLARECIDTIATHAAKMMPKHYQYKNDVKRHITGDINYILSQKPNEYMTTYDFLYKTISLLYEQNNVWVYIDIDTNGYLTGLYPLNPLFCTLVEYKKKIYLKFQFLDGNTYYAEYSNVIHLRRFFSNHDFYGDSNEVLQSAIETQVVTDDGIKNAIKISSSLRGVITATNAMLKDKDIHSMRDEFVKDLFESEKGIAGLDSKMEFKEINLRPILLEKDQLDAVNGNIYKYFRISEKMLQSTFTDEEWSAFYESVIEPLAIQMEQAFTNAIFSESAIKSGHKIEFSVNRIKYAKTDTKIKLLKEVGVLGIIKVDEAREILDLPAIGGKEGNKRLQTLNVINANLADKYQGGTDSEEEEEEEDGKSN